MTSPVRSGTPTACPWITTRSPTIACMPLTSRRHDTTTGGRAERPRCRRSEASAVVVLVVQVGRLAAPGLVGHQPPDRHDERDDQAQQDASEDGPDEGADAEKDDRPDQPLQSALRPARARTIRTVAGRSGGWPVIPGVAHGASLGRRAGYSCAGL